MAELEPGSQAPHFRLASSDGDEVSLDGLRGRAVVLYFYPKDDTPGCTLEAQQFRDLRREFEAANATVLGVSRDTVASHCRFRDKYGLNFPLLADPDGKTLESYGVWKEKVLYGRHSMGIERSTFLIGPDGELQRVWRKVRADGHARAVLDALRAGDTVLTPAGGALSSPRVDAGDASLGTPVASVAATKRGSAKKAASKGGSSKKPAAKRGRSKKPAARPKGAKRGRSKKPAAKTTRVKRGSPKKPGAVSARPSKAATKSAGSKKAASKPRAKTKKRG